MPRIPKSMITEDSQLFNIDVYYGKSLILLVNLRAISKQAAQEEIMRRLKFTIKLDKKGNI